MERLTETAPDFRKQANSFGRSSPDTRNAGLMAAGGLLGTLGVLACCVLPITLFSLGVGGAWLGTLSALAPYQPIITVITLSLLGTSFYFVYRKPKAACAPGDGCGRPLPNRLIKTNLWIATVLVIAATAFNYMEPLLLPILLGS